MREVTLLFARDDGSRVRAGILKQALDAGIPCRAAHGWTVEQRATALDGLDPATDLLAIVGDDTDVAAVASEIVTRELSMLPLAIVPLGGPSDFAAALGIRTCADAFTAVSSGVTQPIDLGRAITREGTPVHFLVSAHAGWAPPVSGPNMLQRLPSRGTRLLAAVTQAASEPHARSFTLSVDGAEHDGRYAGVSFHNVERWRNGILAAPGASPHDGLLDVVRWSDGGRIASLRDLRRQLHGAPPRDGIVHRRPGRVAEISSPRPTVLIADGRRIGYLPARIDVLPGALRFCVLAT